MLPFLIAGLTTGSVYGLAGVGLVLTYRTSGVLNLAHGAIGSVAAYTFYTLHVQHRLSWELAAVISILGIGPVLGVAFGQLARVLVAASLPVRIAGTVGVLLVVQAATVLIYGVTDTRIVPTFLPVHDLTLGGTVVSLPQLAIAAAGFGATGILYAFFRTARLGLAMRALVDDGDLLELTGTGASAVRRLSWLIGASFVCLSGVLLVSVPPPQALTPAALSFLVVSALGAAALGSFDSLLLTYGGGLLIGVASAYATRYVHSGPWSGLAVAMPFLVLFVVLLAGPSRRLVDRAPVVAPPVPGPRVPRPVAIAAGLGTLVAAALVPTFAGLHLADYTRALALAVVLLSLGLLTRTAGAVSLAAVTFMAIGVCAFAHLTGDHGWPWAAGLVGAGVIAMPIGGLLAILAIRLPGLYLAVATLGFGLLAQYLFYGQGFMFGALGLGVQVRRPVSGLVRTDTDTGYYYLVLVLVGICVAVLVLVECTRLGRLLTGLAGSAKALETSGARTGVTRVVVFCLTAFFTAVAGVLEAGSFAAGGSTTVSGDAYQPLTSLVLFALVVVGIGRAPAFALVGALVYTLVPSYVSSADGENWLILAIGVLAVAFPYLRPWLVRAVGGAPSGRPARAVAAGTSRARARAEPGGLDVAGLRVVFGHRVAVDGLTFSARTGRITGLIGPNGSGKTTTFDALCALVPVRGGSVTLDGRSLIGARTAARARRGVGRTFQQPELVENVTVRHNVALGAEAAYAGRSPLAHVVSTRPERRAVRAATDEALRLCGIAQSADRIVATLSAGDRRLTELARCVAGSARILLLDEPSSGLDRAQSARLSHLLGRVVAEHDVGIVLVEHDLALVAEVCDEVYFLESGAVSLHGTVTEVLTSPAVLAAYVGPARTG